MGYSGAYFEGKVYFIPGARGKFKSKELNRGASLDNNTIVLIAPSDNGFDCNDTTLPFEKRVMEFTNFQEAKDILISGTALDTIKACFSPTKDQRFSSGASLVKLLNVKPNVSASIVQDGHTISATIPGSEGNKIRFKITSIDEISITDGTNSYKQTSLDQEDLYIAYTGNGTACTITINATSISSTITGQTDTSLNFSLLLADYPTLADLYDKINSLVGYSCIIKSKPDQLSANLDQVTAISILLGASFKCNFYRQVLFMESTGLVEVTKVGNVPFTNTANFIYLFGGVVGVEVTQDYIDALEFSKEVSGLYRNVCSENIAIASKLSEVVNYLNSPDGCNETFGGCGVDTTLTLDERIDLIKSINNEFVCCGISQIENYKADGVTKSTFGSWYISLLHNSAKASTNPKESLTYKDLNIINCPEMLTKNQKDKVIQAGGLYVDRKPNKGAWKIGFALTTYQKSDSILTQASKVCTVLVMSKDLRESLQERFLAEIVDDADIRIFVNGKLDEYENRYGYLSKNIYTGDPAYDPNYSIQRDADKIYFVFPDAKLVSPINFFFHIFNLSEVKGTSTGV